MAQMIPLAPAVTVDLAPGWELLASEAGRYGQGLTATVQVLNGTVQACQSVPLAQPDKRHAFAETVARLAGVPAAVIQAALLALTAGVEGVLRQMADQEDQERQSQATRLVTLALDAGVELFHTPGADGDAYATLTMAGHTETWPVKVKGFRRWLAWLFYQAEDKSPGSQAVQDAVGVLEGKALFDGPALPVYTRLAEQDGAIYLDLGDEHWQAVEITAGGWRVVASPPVKFRRARGMLPLPLPVPGGTLEDLRPFVNLATAADWCVVVSWVVAALRPTGPYPVLVVHGEQGSAKSTLVQVLRALVDPNTAGLRTTPRDERDLVIAAHNGWLIALDNLSHLQEWLSDALCRLATGGGFATRELYTDADEVIFVAQRPIVFNGIEELATRGDLLDRAILLYLPAIPEEHRQDEKDFWRAFAQAHPRILGALLAAVSWALRTLPSVTLARKPRMADFALWAAAAAPACGWTAEAFLEAYAGVRAAASDLTLDASLVAPFVRELVATQGQWDGPATALLTTLEALAAGGLTSQGTLKAGSDVTKQKGWPKDGRALSNTLRRLAPTLRAVGVTVEFARAYGGQRQRTIRLASTSGSTSPGTGSTPGVS